MTPYLTSKIWKLTQKKTLTSPEKFVLIAISNYTDEEYKAYPSLMRLSLDTGYNIKTVKKARTALVSKGFIIFTGKKYGQTMQIKEMQIVVGKIDPAHEDSNQYIYHASPPPEPAPTKLSTEPKPEIQKQTKEPPKEDKQRPIDKSLNRPTLGPQNNIYNIYKYNIHTTNYKDVGTSVQDVSKSNFFNQKEIGFILASIPIDSKFNPNEVINLCKHHITHKSAPNFSRTQRIKGFCTLMRGNRFVPPRGYISDLEREKKLIEDKATKLNIAYQEYYSEYQHCIKYDIPFTKSDRLLTKEEFREIHREFLLQ